MAYQVAVGALAGIVAGAVGTLAPRELFALVVDADLLMKIAWLARIEQTCINAPVLDARDLAESLTVLI